MVNDNVDMISMVSDIISMISEVNLVGSNNKEGGLILGLPVMCVLIRVCFTLSERITMEISCTWATLKLLISRVKEM
jgi:hypothetical protein